MINPDIPDTPGIPKEVAHRVICHLIRQIRESIKDARVERVGNDLRIPLIPNRRGPVALTDTVLSIPMIPSPEGYWGIGLDRAKDITMGPHSIPAQHLIQGLDDPFTFGLLNRAIHDAWLLSSEMQKHNGAATFLRVLASL